MNSRRKPNNQIKGSGRIGSSQIKDQQSELDSLRRELEELKTWQKQRQSAEQEVKSQTPDSPKEESSDLIPPKINIIQPENMEKTWRLNLKGDGIFVGDKLEVTIGEFSTRLPILEEKGDLTAQILKVMCDDLVGKGATFRVISSDRRKSELYSLKDWPK